MKSHIIEEFAQNPVSLDIDKLTPTVKAVIERWNNQPNHLRTMSEAELMSCTVNDLCLIRFIMYMKTEKFAPSCPGTGRSFISYEDRKKMNKFFAYVYGEKTESRE